MREEERIMAGLLFNPGDPELKAIKKRSHDLSHDYNKTYEEETEVRSKILAELLGEMGENCFFQGPITVHYGSHTKVGKNNFFNFNFTVQDDAMVTIGDHNNFGPNVTIVTPIHPMIASERHTMLDPDGNPAHVCYALPVTIGDDCWLGANVVVCSSQGAYLATNRYSSDRKKGYIGMRYRLLFTPKELEVLTEEQIHEQLLQAIRYNDFAFNRGARHTYVGKKPNAFGIDSILYLCPACRGEHTLRVQEDAVVCESCGFRVRVNEYYDLVEPTSPSCPADIDAWYKWQRRCVADQVQASEFEMTLRGSLCALRLDKLKKWPKNTIPLSVGTARLTRDGLSFSGTLNGKAADFDFSARSVYSLTLSTKGYLEFYCNNEYYMLIPEQPQRGLIKWTLAAEEIHNLYDERWRSACADVYGMEDRDDG